MVLMLQFWGVNKKQEIMEKQIALAVLIFFAIGKALSQDFQGKAVYKTKRQFDIQLDSTQMNDALMNQMKERLKSHFEKDYTLKFNKTESLYTENEKLQTPSAEGGGVRVEISSGSNDLFKNTAEGTYARQIEMMGKLFLIKDKLEAPEWKLEKETKKIGKYTCFKATRTKEITQREFASNEDEVKETKKEIVTTVWYTPEIPVQHGPAEYWGLPGLILEVQEDKFSILCSEIVLNPKDTMEIEEPTKGKEVNQEEYDKIQEEKSKEMMERYSGGKKGGNVIMIRSGS